MLTATRSVPDPLHAADQREQHAVIAMLDRQAIAAVPLDATGAVRLAMIASELRAGMAREPAL